MNGWGPRLGGTNPSLLSGVLVSIDSSVCVIYQPLRLSSSFRSWIACYLANGVSSA